MEGKGESGGKRKWDGVEDESERKLRTKFRQTSDSDSESDHSVEFLTEVVNLVSSSSSSSEESDVQDGFEPRSYSAQSTVRAGSPDSGEGGSNVDESSGEEHGCSSVGSARISSRESTVELDSTIELTDSSSDEDMSADPDWKP